MTPRQHNLDYINRRWPVLRQQIEPWLNSLSPQQALSGYTIARLRQSYFIPDGQTLFDRMDSLVGSAMTDLTSPAYHLLVLGISPLLPDLLTQILPRHLLLHETRPWRLLWSLDHLDWEATFTPVPAATILFTPEESMTAEALLDRLRFQNNLMCEEIVMAHTGPDTEVLAQHIIPQRHHLFHGWSTMDKRLRALRNSRHTMTEARLRLWRSHPPRLDAPPVMIVGSGPSAELLMDEIRRLAPHCLVVAAGTASHVLMQGGVTPDLAVIVGNDHGYYNEHRLAVDRWPVLRTLPLLINQAADPRFAALGNPLALFGYPDNPLPCDAVQTPAMTAPTVTNAAVALMAEAGFCDLIFFGIDMGARRLDHRYATTHPRVDPGAIPYASGYNPDMPLKVRGNFGGQVFTSPTFDVARQTFEGFLVTHPQVRARNCADGALIRGAQPCMAKKLMLGDSLVDKAALVTSLWQEFPLYDPTAAAGDWALPRFLEEMEDLRQSLHTALQQDGVYAMADALWPRVHHHRPLLGLRLMADSLLAMLSYALFRLNSLSPAEQQRLLPQARVLLGEAVDELCQKTTTALCDLDAGRDGPWLVWDED